VCIGVIKLELEKQLVHEAKHKKRDQHRWQENLKEQSEYQLVISIDFYNQ